MRKLLQLLHRNLCRMTILVILLGFSQWSSAQTHSQNGVISVRLVSIDSNEARFDWGASSTNTTSVYRKTKSATSWTQIASGITIKSYVDSSISPNTEYEYMFEATTSSYMTDIYGYISVAYNLELDSVVNRGDILVVVESLLFPSLSTELSDLENDLISDGWNPLFISHSSSTGVSDLKSRIDSADGVHGLDAVYLIGHLPVPYSGEIMPDGHTDHRGAWPTDLYYVTPATDWSDVHVIRTNTARPANENIRHDGKFDQNTISSELMCPIGRVDFYNLTKSPTSELQMVKDYLEKASDYKRGHINPMEVGIIEDNFTSISEGFASNGFGNFSAICDDSLVVSDVLTGLVNNGNYKWLYVCGPGTDTSMSGFATVSQLHNADYQGVFGMMLGSYFGDWNTQDNLMRSSMANGKLLTNVWAGRPNWFFHHMGLDNPIGYSVKKSIENEDNTGDYMYRIPGNYPRGVHMNLLGDPTLRNTYLPVLSNFNAITNNSTGNTLLSWTPPSAAVDKIKIHKYDNIANEYKLLTELGANDSSFSDTTTWGTNSYYIGYTSLIENQSGSYYSQSSGTFKESITFGVLPVELLSFDGEKVDQDAHLNWVVAQEHDFSHYEVFKSPDASTWTQIGTVRGKGNSAQLRTYSFLDYRLNEGKTYYKLRMVDLDGSAEYSNIVALQMKENDEIRIFPNPSVGGEVEIRSKKEVDMSSIKIYNAIGVEQTFTIRNNKIEHNLPAGNYIIRKENAAIRWTVL